MRNERVKEAEGDANRCPPRGGVMILLVEDDAATRDSLALLFECESLECRAFASAEAFVAANPLVDGACLLFDVHMPGMTGLDLLEHLRARGVAAPAVMITGQVTPSILTRAAAARATVFEKPFASDLLIERIRALLAGNAA
jgi:two-component system response regulator FixJ